MAQAQELEDGPAEELPDIPFNVASVEGRELDYVQDVVRGGHLSSGGAFARRAAELLAADSGAAEVLMTTSCTAALELSAMLLDLQAGRHGHRPVVHLHHHGAWRSRAQGAGLLFCDIEPDTLGLDPAAPRDAPRRARARGRDRALRRRRVRRRRGSATSWPTGPTCSSSRTTRTASSARWRGEPLGSLGRFATLSFHETKNFVCGEGGALAAQRPRRTSTAPACSTTRAPTATPSCSARSTSTPGRTPARRSASPTCSPPTSSASSSSAT